MAHRVDRADEAAERHAVGPDVAVGVKCDSRSRWQPLVVPATGPPPWRWQPASYGCLEVQHRVDGWKPTVCLRSLSIGFNKISHENISDKRAASGGAGLNVSVPAIISKRWIRWVLGGPSVYRFIHGLSTVCLRVSTCPARTS